MKIESGIRLLAGSLVLLGLALGHFASPWWLLLPAFTAALLVQSAFTRFCPAEIILSRLSFRASSGPRRPPGDCLMPVRSGEALLVDVREPAEWTAGVAQSAALLPFSDLTGPRRQWREFLGRAAGRELLLYCASGTRSGQAARILAAEGFRAANTGSLRDWAGAGWPLVRPEGQNQRRV